MSCSGNSKNYTVILLMFLISCTSSTNKKTIIIKESKNLSQEQAFSIERVYNLSKEPDYETEENFKKTVEEAYSKTFDEYNTGFTYSITPEGTIYPFSKVNVKCMGYQTSSKNRN